MILYKIYKIDIEKYKSIVYNIYIKQWLLRIELSLNDYQPSKFFGGAYF